MAEHASKPVLEKEVLAPQNPYSGLGVVLVASLAMFLAMASSAFVIRARMVRQSCPSHGAAHQQQLPAAQDWHALERVSPQECGQPVYYENIDGSMSVLYRACPDGRLDQRDVSRIGNVQPAGIEIRRVR